MLLIGAVVFKDQVQAITEEPDDKVIMRDASATKDRPRLDYDIDEDSKK